MQSPTPNWPIAQLHQNQSIFLTDVAARSLEALQSRYTDKEQLIQLLRHTFSSEQYRITHEKWPCDLADDGPFWQNFAYALNSQLDPAELLHSLIKRYLREIHTTFSIDHYSRISKLLHLLFCGVCKTIHLSNKLHITGEVALLRRLAQEHTIILVPTHSSHLDSAIIGLAMRNLGLPPLTWGAGLNLLNNRWFRYMFNQLGTYKVDRRKKNIPYLQIQKDYTCSILEQGCHTLFYPAGTRTRSGSIENEVKLGLLSTPLQAQINIFGKQGATGKKLCIVPLVLNYHCVPEALELMSELDPLRKKPSKRDQWFNKCASISKLLCKGSELFIRIGGALDVVGNRINLSGGSYQKGGKEVDLYSQLMGHSLQQHRSLVQGLSKKIVSIYAQIHQVLSSHLIAFVAYQMGRQQGEPWHKDGPICLPHDAFMQRLFKAYEAVFELYGEGRLHLTPIVMKGTLEAIAQDGTSHLGVYHPKSLIKRKKNGDLWVQDMGGLLYYHNRLTGYGIESKLSI